MSTGLPDTLNMVLSGTYCRYDGIVPYVLLLTWYMRTAVPYPGTLEQSVLGTT